MKPMTAYHKQVLRGLVEAGHGKLDRSGRVCVEPISAPIMGDPIAWLVLVSNGLVAGERGILMPTEEGRAYAGVVGERVREST